MDRLVSGCMKNYVLLIRIVWDGNINCTGNEGTTTAEALIYNASKVCKHQSYNQSKREV